MKFSSRVQLRSCLEIVAAPGGDQRDFAGYRTVHRNASRQQCELSLRWRLSPCLSTASRSVFSDRAFAYIGLLSSVASLVILALLVYGGLNEPEWANPTSFIADLDYLPSTSAMILFTAGTHPLICSVMHTTRSHKELRRATVAAWTFFTIVTVAVGGVLYQIYGDALQPAVMANVKHELRSVAGIWMLVKVLGNYIPLTRPLGNALGRALGVTQTAGPVLMAPVLLCLAVVAAFFSEKLEAMCWLL